MTRLPADALLERPRIRSGLQHRFVVIGLQDEQVATLDAFPDELAGIPQIGDYCSHTLTPGEAKRHRVLGVVRE